MSDYPGWIEAPNLLDGRATRALGGRLWRVADLSPEVASVCRGIERSDGPGAAKAYLWQLFLDGRLPWREPTEAERSTWDTWAVALRTDATGNRPPTGPSGA